jgi:hypothetical protein
MLYLWVGYQNIFRRKIRNGSMSEARIILYGISKLNWVKEGMSVNTQGYDQIRENVSNLLYLGMWVIILEEQLNFISYILYGCNCVSLQREILGIVIKRILKTPTFVLGIWQAAVCVNDALTDTLT